MPRERIRPEPRLTGDRLVEIEVRARVVTLRRVNTHQQAAIARLVCAQDVPDLLVEIRRLRSRLGHIADSEPAR